MENLYVKLMIEVGEADSFGTVVRVDQQHPFIQYFGDDPEAQIELQKWLTTEVSALVMGKMFEIYLMGDEYIADRKGKKSNS